MVTIPKGTYIPSKKLVVGRKVMIFVRRMIDAYARYTKRERKNMHLMRVKDLLH